MNDGGSIEINCGSGGATGVGGDIEFNGGHGGYGDWMQYYDADTLAKMNAGQPHSDEKALIKNNPCWPYISVSAKSELELCLDALEPIETSALDFASLVSEGAITFSNNQNWDTISSDELREAKEQIDYLLRANVLMTNTINDLETRLSFLETSQPWKDFV